MSKIIAVTGATGKIGKAISEKLLESNVKVRAIARNPENLKLLETKGAEIFPFNLENTSSLKKIFKGADAVFSMIPPCYHLSNYQEVQKQIAASITEAIQSAAIQHAVILSSVGADLASGNGHIAPLYTFETMLKAVPDLSVMVLRSAFFMENHLGSIPLIKNTGINGGIINPDCAIGMISTKDVADIAVEYLQNTIFTEYNIQYLLGPRDYTFSEATSILGAAIGKPNLNYVRFSYADFSKGMIQGGFSARAADDLFEGLTALGEEQLTKNVYRNAFNTTPTKLEEFAREIFAPAYDSLDKKL